MFKVARLFQPWNSARNLICLSGLGIVLGVGLGYQYAETRVFVVPPPQALQSIDRQSLQDVQLPSMIPDLHLAAKRHWFFPIDLRRAHLLIGEEPDEPLSALTPLMDKVLVVPKLFGKYDS